MNERTSAVDAYGKYTGKDVNVMRKGYEEYTIYKLYNVYPDGTLELISQASDDSSGRVFVTLIHVSDIEDISIDIDDTDIEITE
jgi:hypothetical protein